MPANKPKFYLTTPIYYTNGLPHIGHTYSTIVCDTIRRYKRMRGYDVVMTTGTDEHGVNVERAAKKAGVPESEFVAKMAAEWKALWDELGIPSDEFIRTTDLKHAHTVQWLFKLCRENGFVYPGHYTGQYCIYDNAYVDVNAVLTGVMTGVNETVLAAQLEKPLHGVGVQWLFKLCRENGFVYPGHYTGQYCIYDNAYVDVKPGENCPDCGRPTETVTEPNYFFKLSAFQKPLLDWYAQRPEFIQPEEIGRA